MGFSLKDIYRSFNQEGSFLRNSSYLFSSRVFTTIMAVLLTPILTRLYNPESYGYFSLINAIILNFSMVSSLSYDNALVIIKKEREFYNLLLSCVLLSLIFTSLLLLGLVSLTYFLDNSYSLYEFLRAPYFITLTVVGGFIYANAQLFSKWNVRRAKFLFISKVWVSHQIMNKLVSLLLGYFYAPVFGLVLGELSGKVLSIFLNIRYNIIKEWKSLIRLLSKKESIRVLFQWKSYPKYILPDKYISMLVNQAPIFILSFYFGASILGNFSLSMSIIGLPIILIANTMSSVILKKTSDSKSNKEEIRQFIRKGVTLITLLLLPCFVILILFSDDLFSVIFGSNWLEAGRMASIIAAYSIVQMYQVFAMPLFQVYEKEKKALLINSFQLIFILVFTLPGIFLKDALLIIAGYGLVRYVFGWMQIVSSFRLVEVRVVRHIALVSLSIIITLLTKYLFL